MVVIINVDITRNEVNTILVIPSECANLAYGFSENATNKLPKYELHDL